MGYVHSTVVMQRLEALDDMFKKQYGKILNTLLFVKKTQETEIYNVILFK